MISDFRHLFAEYPPEILLQTIPAGLFLVDPHLKIIYWNAEAERITGYSAVEAVGRHCSFLEGIPCGEQCGLFSEDITKPVIGVSCSIMRKDGQRVDLSKNVDLLLDKHGQVIGGVEAFVDISRLKKLEHDLRGEVEDRTRELELEKSALHSVLDAMTDPVYICAADFKIIFINRAMRDIFGTIENQLCYQAIHQLGTVCAGCPLSEVLTGQVICGERELRGTGRTFEIIHSPYPIATHPTHKIGVFRDITDRKAAEQRLQQVNQELDAFVARVSHDLRSPLTPLIGFAELLEERYSDQFDALGRESLAEIKLSASKMMILLEDLLTLARVGQLENPRQKVNAGQIAEDVLLELSEQVVEHQARVNIAELPDFRMPESLLAELFRNLLGNALKYAVRQDPRVEISGQLFADRVQYRVVDHGPGVVADERGEIFEPFKRGSNSRGLLGSGVGLATVAKICRVYNGSARIEETPGGGATFVVELFPPID